MTPIETTDCDLAATRDKWLDAMQLENREAEAICMRRLERRAHLARQSA